MTWPAPGDWLAAFGPLAPLWAAWAAATTWGAWQDLRRWERRIDRSDP